jgi:FMN phosphatase YigB (HAD superfamily)
VGPCLERLNSYRLGVISNGQTVQQRLKLARTGIADRFESIVMRQAQRGDFSSSLFDGW